MKKKTGCCSDGGTSDHFRSMMANGVKIKQRHQTTLLCRDDVLVHTPRHTALSARQSFNCCDPRIYAKTYTTNRSNPRFSTCFLKFPLRVTTTGLIKRMRRDCPPWTRIIIKYLRSLFKLQSEVEQPPRHPVPERMHSKTWLCIYTSFSFF